MAFAGLGIITWWSCNPGESEKEKKTTQKPTVLAAPLFEISLAQWSLHRAHRVKEMTALDFAQRAKREFDINAIEYVNAFFEDKAKDMDYLKDLKGRADGEGVKNLLIMIDNEGDLGSVDEQQRKTAVENHFKWVEAAKFLGCHSIRVNAAGKGSREAVAGSSIKSLSELSNFAKDFGINIIVENHGGYSSDGTWISDVMTKVNLPNCGTLPDFGNFCITKDDNPVWAEKKCLEDYDRYKGTKEMMPFAKAVSAKSHDFDESGNEVNTDFSKMMKIVLQSGFNGYVGIEYEGNTLSEPEGILATKKLLEKVRSELKM